MRIELRKIPSSQRRPHHAGDGLARTFHKAFLHMAQAFVDAGEAWIPPHWRYLIYYAYTLTIQNNRNNTCSCQFSNLRRSPSSAKNFAVAVDRPVHLMG
jgi:hypothetical protein